MINLRINITQAMLHDNVFLCKNQGILMANNDILTHWSAVIKNMIKIGHFSVLWVGQFFIE